jgi:medium-chain acyl-[acyl-carrier-protein] hydrolase
MRLPPDPQRSTPCRSGDRKAQTVASPATDDWFVPVARRPNATVVMLAFPQAGGGCSAFAEHSQAMPGWLELRTLNLPGRQARFGEALRTDLAGLVADLVADCAQCTGPYLMYGYCSGALLAYLVSRGLSENGTPMPRRLVVGSYPAPHLITSTPIDALGSEQLWQALVDYRAVMPQLAQHAELRAVSEPVIRADLNLVSQYKHVPAPPLPVPITVLAGRTDDWAPAHDFGSWQRYTTHDIQAQLVPAGHWFMDENPLASAEVLIAEAAAVRP